MSKYFFSKNKLLFFLLFVLLWIFSDLFITVYSKKYLYDSVEKVPFFETALLLGTSKNYNGFPNPFFYNRIDATVELFENNKIKNIIVSGDNSLKSYNESDDMKSELISRGIPAEVIYSDYAGLRTLDSVLRAKEIFSQEKFIVISQKFHIERTIFLGRFNDIDVYGFRAKSVSYDMWLRERLARVKMYFDIFFNVKPKYLGEKIFIK
jgi:SanA protein